MPELLCVCVCVCGGENEYRSAKKCVGELLLFFFLHSDWIGGSGSDGRSVHDGKLGVSEEIS